MESFKEISISEHPEANLSSKSIKYLLLLMRSVVGTETRILRDSHSGEVRNSGTFEELQALQKQVYLGRTG